MLVKGPQVPYERVFNTIWARQLASNTLNTPEYLNAKGLLTPY